MSESNNLSNKQSNRYKFAHILVAMISFLILVGIDQYSKYYIVHSMKLHDSIPVVKDVFEIHYIHNPGAAWGMFENQQLFFYICTIVVCIFGVLCYLKCLKLCKYQDLRVLLVIALSGAIGNFIDRIRFQYVIDFLYFKLIDFPVFNIADCYVTVSFFFMIILLLFKYKEEDIEEILRK